MESKNENKKNNTINNSLEKKDEFIDFREVKSKKRKLIIGITIPLLIILIFLGIYLFIKSNYNAEKFLDNNFKKVNNTINSIIDKLNLNDIKTLENKITTSGKIKFETTSIDLKDLNNVALEYNINSIAKENYMDYDITLSQTEKASLNINGMINNSKIYLSSKDLTDNTYYFDIDNTSDTLSKYNDLLNEENIKYIVKNILNYLNISLKQSIITTKYDKLNVIYTYEVNDSNKSKINDNFKNLLKEDSKLLSLLNITKDDIDYMDDIFDNFKLEITINILNNSIKEFIITTTDEKLIGTQIDKNKMKITSLSSNDYIELEYSDKKLGITLYENNKSTNKLLIEVNNNETKINYSQDDKTLEINITDSTFKATLKIDNFSINMDFNIKDKETEGIININNNDENIKLVINNTVLENNNINKKEINNAINIENITDDELNKIITNGSKVMENFDVINILDDITNIMDNTEI